MDKIIKKIKINNLNNKYAYHIGYNLCFNEVYPQIEIYKNKKLISIGYFSNDIAENKFHFSVYYSSYYSATSILDMFKWIKKFIEIPKEVEKEFENIFLIYKLNDFKEKEL